MLNLWDIYRMQSAVDRSKLPGRHGKARRLDDPGELTHRSCDQHRKCNC